MTVWISRRPAADVAADRDESRRTAGTLAGARLAVNVDVAGMSTTTSARPEFAGTPDSDAPAIAVLRRAGAVVVASGEVDIAIATDAACSGVVPAAWQGIVGITPTRGVVSADGVAPARESTDRIMLFASTVPLADRAMGVLAAGAPARPWPADVKLAAPPTPVVAIPDELPELDRRGRTAFDAATDTLAAAGCRIVTVEIAPFLAAAKLSYDGALASETYSGVGEFIDSQHRDRLEAARLRELAMAALADADALLVPTVLQHLQICDVTAFDMCGVAVPASTAGDAHFGVTVLARAFDDAVALDIAALLTDEPTPQTVWPLAVAEHVELVVFGAHLRGGPLVHQLTDRGARFAGEITTAPRYRMTALSTTPAKPGVVRVPDGADGAALTGHRWLLSPAALGRFLADLPAPMQLGKVEFADGSWRTAFGCDGSAQGVDISGYGSWTTALAAGAVRQT